MKKNFLKSLGFYPKNPIFINKQKKKGCFTANNNLGLYSDEQIKDFNEAVKKFRNLNYSHQAFTNIAPDGIYVSYDKEYNPIISNRVYRLELNGIVSYRWIVTNDKGKIVKNILIDKN